MPPCNPSSRTRREFLGTGAAAAAAALVAARPTCAAIDDVERAAITRTRSHNPAMEYRRLGRTGLWVSAVCMGGHWKRVEKVLGTTGALNPCIAPTDPAVAAPFARNRAAVIDRCIERGINYIDYAGDSEPEVYSRILRTRRDAMYIGYSHPASELRVPANRTAKRLLELFDAGLKRCGLDSVDLWRLMVLERGGRHTDAETDAMLEALATARKQGKCRFTGMSTHDRPWAKAVIEANPDIIQVLCFPYTADSRDLPADSLFDTLRRHDVGTFGIKPFASNAIFKGDGSPDHPEAPADDRRARIVLRHILTNPAITAPIPGLASVAQVDNAAAAVGERRELDLSERAELDTLRQSMWANLAPDHRWLEQWRHV